MDIVIAARSTPLFGTAPVAAILLSLAAVAAAGPLSRADSLYALRAMGAEGHRAKPQPIAAAIAAYSEIAATRPRELAAQWRLLRALFFEAQYTDRSAEERKRLLRQAMSGILPDTICTRWNKQGFLPPQNAWFANGLGELARDMVENVSFRERGYWNVGWWRRIIKRLEAGEGHLAWLLWKPVISEAWQRHFVDEIEARPRIAAFTSAPA